MGTAHLNGPPNRLGQVAQWRLLPRTSPLPDLVSRYTDLTVPKTLPLAFSQQFTPMKRMQTHQSSPSAFGNELSQRSSKVRLVGTSNSAPFVHLKPALTRHQSSIFSLRGVRLGRPELLSNVSLVQPGTT
jgi:hypothetical protein